MGDYDVNEQTASVSLLAVTSGVGFFTSLLPSLADVRKATGDADMINDVRLGEAAALGLTIAVGLMASSFTDSPVPAMIAIGASLGMVVMYENVLTTIPKEKRA